MKLNKKILKKGYFKPIFLGFSIFYLVSMLLCTYLIKAEYSEQYVYNLSTQMTAVATQINNFFEENNWDGEELTEDQKRLLTYILSYIPQTDAYNPMSMALYDYNGNLVAQTSNLSSIQGALPSTPFSTEPSYLFFDLDEYLTKDELYELAEFTQANYDVNYSSGNTFIKGNSPYLIDIKIDAATYDLEQILVYEAVYEKSETDSFYPEYELTDKTLIWKWIHHPENTDSAITLVKDSDGPFFPYLENGISFWKKWNNNEHLQIYPEKIESGYKINEYGYTELTIVVNDHLDANGCQNIVLCNESGTEYQYMLVYRCEYHAWLAAMNHMKYIYIWGFFMAVFCIIKVLYSTEKTYEKQRLLEEARRDFTNAIAHELKTPLGIIRGFAENLKENTITEKRNYYLNQIIGQTEEMDSMVQKIIYISKLDSDQLILKKEPVNLLELFQNQLKKLEISITEKNLNIQIIAHEDFVIDGDKLYLEKALWNLAANAVSYNCENGIISIICDTDQLRIENTGTPIPESDLPHVFDMFYTGDQSRNSREKHLGLGLYLVKKIFTLHHLSINISNANDRISVVISR